MYALSEESKTTFVNAAFGDTTFKEPEPKIDIGNIRAKV
jgi:hypothetical protein